MPRSHVGIFAVLVLTVTALASLALPPAGVPPQDIDLIDRQISLFRKRMAKEKSSPTAAKDLLADADLFCKAVEWAWRYEARLDARTLAQLQRSLKRAEERLDAIAAGKTDWSKRKGKLVRGYFSEVDGSVQPYGLIIPASYDPGKPTRLDVVLHGSVRPTGLNELQFLNRFDEGDGPEKAAPAANFIELHPLGRVENCYRWSGETDVFESIEAVCRQYNIDRDRIVLRGMSMGASGTWHLGLKHPSRFVAIGPYCGYVDTREFSKTPLGNFVRVGELPQYQDRMLHMLDSVDYAANAGVVPAIACMGEKDVFFQAHVLMGQAMAKEGLKIVNLISPGTGHVIDPKTHAEQMRQIGEYAGRGLDHAPRTLRFVTWTLKYSRCHWLQILGLEEHYRRAEIQASIEDDGSIRMKEPTNITRFAILPPVAHGKPRVVHVGADVVKLPAKPGEKVSGQVMEKVNGHWIYRGELDAVELKGKRPGLQGPIDDAFCTPFLCVRGTGEAANPTVQKWADASLKRFAHEWARYFRGDLPIKDDTAVTDEEMRSHHLILFGDPGSNRLIARTMPGLPVKWTTTELQVGKERYPAKDHVPLFIHPNPLAKGKYIVCNSGHTFREKELTLLNYLLFPRLGDWAVLKIGEPPAKPGDPLTETVIQSGFFDEQWGMPGS